MWQCPLGLGGRIWLIYMLRMLKAEQIYVHKYKPLGGNLAELFSRTIVGSDIEPISSLTKDFEYLRVPGMNYVLRKPQIQLK